VPEALVSISHKKYCILSHLIDQFKEGKFCTISVPKYNTSSTKLRVLNFLAIVINLLIVGNVFIILSFKKDNLFIFYQNIYRKVLKKR
jgi:hypothetical protein